MAGNVPHCQKCPKKSVIRPDVVFFGEPVNPRFFESLQSDFEKCDLLVVMGTSLLVYPFAGLCNNVRTMCPRLLFNREATGPFKFMKPKWNYRDVSVLKDCDDGVKEFADLMAWKL